MRVLGLPRMAFGESKTFKFRKYVAKIASKNLMVSIRPWFALLTLKIAAAYRTLVGYDCKALNASNRGKFVSEKILYRQSNG